MSVLIKETEYQKVQSYDDCLYYMKRAKILLDYVQKQNGDNDHFLPIAGNKELIEIINDLQQLIDRSSDFEEYDLG
jgi:hypothetical protein|tara:strand:- start:19 stop:246 length:228 start_codon:yes stop_codon:yes gene_type:complete